MIGGALHKTIKLAGTLGTGLVIIALLLAWRLSSGPISLGFLSPYMEDALSAATESFDIEFDDTTLAWAGWDRALDIRVLNVRAVDTKGAVVASVPELSLSLSAQGLLRGTVALRNIELFRPRLWLVRRRDGGFETGLKAGTEGSAELFRGILAALAAPPDRGGSMGYLTRVAVIDADLTVEDERLETLWRAPSTQIALQRTEIGIDAEVSFDLRVDDQVIPLSAVAEYRIADQRLDAGVSFGTVNPALLSRVSPRFQEFAHFAVPVRGTLTIGMDSRGTVDDVGFHVIGGGGELTLPEPAAQRLEIDKLELRGRYDGRSGVTEFERIFLDLGDRGAIELPAASGNKMPVRSLSARGRYDIERDTLHLTALEADLGGPTARLTAEIEGIAGVRGPIALTLKGAVEDVPVDGARRYWPPAWGSDVYAWCTNHFSGGVLKQVSIETRILEAGDGRFEVVSLTGGMDIQGISVDYLEAMPAVENVDATASFDLRRFDIAISEGSVMGLRVDEGTIAFSGLDMVNQDADIEIAVHGPLRNALELIDHEPLQFASELGFTPSKIEGTMEARLRLKFPVEKALTFERVGISATSMMRDVVARDVFGFLDIHHGTLRLAANKDGMDVRGDAVIGTIPAELVWRENFRDTAEGRSRYELRGRVNHDQRLAELHLDFPPFSADTMSGPMDARVVYSVFHDDRSRLEAALNLSQTYLSWDRVAWSKLPGTDGAASISLDLNAARAPTEVRFDVRAGDLTAKGEASFDPQGGAVRRARLETLRFGETDIEEAELTPLAGGGWSARIAGPSFDLAPMLDNPFDGVMLREGDSEAGPLLRLEADFGRVRLGPGRELRELKGILKHDGRRWFEANVRGTVNRENETFSITIASDESGTREIAIDSTAAGDLFRAFDVYEDMVGGHLELRGKFDDADSNAPFSGTLEVADYRVLETPLLARLLSIMALTGILEALQDEGLNFTSLDAEFTLEKGELKITDARAAGPSLGFTASGTLDAASGRVDMLGTVVPAYLINSIWGRIPVLGDLLTGGEKGGGVFAASYAMTGRWDDPEIAINPLSLLAPGFLRKMFDFLDPKTFKIEAPNTDEAGSGD